MSENEDALRPCPACAESIRVAAVKCRFCGHVMGYPVRPAAPAAPAPQSTPKQPSDQQVTPTAIAAALIVLVVGCFLAWRAANDSSGSSSHPPPPTPLEPALIAPTRSDIGVECDGLVCSISNVSVVSARACIALVGGCRSGDSIRASACETVPGGGKVTHIFAEQDFGPRWNLCEIQSSKVEITTVN